MTTSTTIPGLRQLQFQVEFGTTSGYSILPLSIRRYHVAFRDADRLVTAGTSYSYAVISLDLAGTATSANYTFATATTAPTIPVIAVFRRSYTTTANVTWTTDQPSGSQSDYAITSAYGSATALSSTLVTSHSVTLRRDLLQDYLQLRGHVRGLGRDGNVGNFTFSTLSASLTVAISPVGGAHNNTG